MTLTKLDKLVVLQRGIEDMTGNWLYALEIPSTEMTYFGVNCIGNMSPSEADRTAMFVRARYKNERGEAAGFRTSTYPDSPVTVSSTFYGLKALEKLGRLDSIEPPIRETIFAFVNSCAEGGGFKEDRYSGGPSIQATLRAYEIYSMLDGDSVRPEAATLDSVSAFLGDYLDENWISYTAMAADLLDRSGLLERDYLQRAADVLERSEKNDLVIEGDSRRYSGVYIDPSKGKITTNSTPSGIRLLRILKDHWVKVREPDYAGTLEYILAQRQNPGFTWPSMDIPNIFATYDAKDVITYLYDAKVIDYDQYMELTDDMQEFSRMLRGHDGGFLWYSDERVSSAKKRNIIPFPSRVA